VFKSKPPAKRRKMLFKMTATGQAQLMPAVLNAALSARAISAALLFVVAAVAVELVVDEAFYIYNPAVVGNQRVPASDIIAASGIETLHILWLQPESTSRALTLKMSELHSASVGCALPARCTIQVVEREPALEWKQGQTRTWVDAEGMAFPARGQTPAIPVIEVAPEVPALLPGRHVAPELLSAIADLVRVLPDVKTFRYTTGRGFEFADPQGRWPVYVGVGPDMAARVSMWKALAANLASRNVRPRYIDVRYPQAPHYGK